MVLVVQVATADPAATLKPLQVLLHKPVPWLVLLLVP